MGSQLEGSTLHTVPAQGLTVRRAALFNDTGRTNHVGCRGVSLSHDLMLSRLGFEIGVRGYLGEWGELWQGDRAGSLRAFWHSDLPRRLSSVDAVVVNGEGTIHHGGGLQLLAILAGAQEMRLPTFLVNAVFQECEQDLQTLMQLSDFTVRDAASSAYLKRLGVPHRVVLDSILEAPFDAVGAHDFRDKIVVTDWHCAREKDVGAGLQMLLREFGAEAVFYPLESQDRDQDWRHALADLAQARLVVTGRHHGVCLAGMAGVPFVALASNTWKVEGMLDLLPGRLRVCSDVSELRAHCREALSNQPVFARVKQFMHEQLPLATFERLAQLTRTTPAKLQQCGRPASIVSESVVERPVGNANAAAGDEQFDAPPAIVKPPPRITVLDETSRHFELYGRAFDLLGVHPQCGHNQPPEQVIESKPDIILLSREWSYDWRLCAAAARRANIPVVYVMDGVLEWSYVWNNLSYVRGEGTVLQPLIASDLCVIGQHPARILAGLGLSPRIHVTGLPRYDRFDRKRVVDAAAQPRILITTARTYGHNVEQKISVLQAARDLKAWFDANPFVQPVWRIASDLAEEIGVPSNMQGTLGEALQNSSALISFPSTCVLEGMLKGLPVAQIEYRPVPSYVSSAWEIRCAAHIPSVMQELLYPPPNRLAFQDACLAEELEPGDASDRLAQVIRTALDTPEPYACSAPKTRVFGRLDYRQIHSELSAFAASPLSVLQYELDAAYAVIKRLKRERDTLRKGGAGDSPAPSGGPPDGTAETVRTLQGAPFADQRLAVPVGEPPAGAGESPAPPLAKASASGAASPLPPLNHTPTCFEGPRVEAVPGGARDDLRSFLDKDDVDGAIKLLHSMLQADPKNAALWDCLGEAAWKSKQFGEAGEAFNHAALICPGLPALWVRLGVVHRELGQMPESAAALQFALQANPKHEDATRELGITRLIQKRHEEAATLFGRLLDANPDDLRSLLLVARCEFEMGDRVIARLKYLQALKLDPENAEAKESLKVCENLRLPPPASQTEKALVECDRAQPLCPTPEMLAREYPCPYAFTQLYIVPRTKLDVRFCSYHGPVLFDDQAKVYERGLDALDKILHGHPQLVQRRNRFLAGDYKGAGCSENCIWFNKWKTSGKGFKLAGYLSADGHFKLGTIWLSMGPDCNVTCRYCLEPGEFKMDFNTCDPAVMNLARDFVRRGGELLLTGGETFLPKWGLARILDELIHFGDARGTISLHTNGTYLNEENRGLLLRGPVSTVGISMDTLRKDLFEYLRRGTNFDVVWNNVTSLVRERNQSGLKKPDIILLCAVMKSTAGHIVETVDRAVEAGLGISLNALFQSYFSPAFSAGEGLHNLSPAELEKLHQDILHLEKKYGPNSPVGYQGFKGQVENQLQLAKSGGGEKQVILGGGGHAPRLPHFEKIAKAEALARAGDFQAAAAEIEPVLTLLNRSTRGQLVWGAIQAGLNNLPAAIEACRLALQLDPNNAGAKESLKMLEEQHPPQPGPPVCRDGELTTLAATLDAQPDNAGSWAGLDSTILPTLRHNLHMKPWYGVHLPGDILDVPSMLHEYERRLLFSLARDFYRGEGEIIDGGCFLGGSTVSLGGGVAANKLGFEKTRRIHVYDRFIVEKGMLQGPEIGEMLKGLQENDSFRPRFDRFVQPYADHLAVHEGDILQKNWDGRPIEICFIDVAKTWAIQNWVVTQWFPNLRPGSIVVQQDFFHNYTGYIPMVMEHYADYFELIDALEWETAVFLCTKQIPAEACRMDFSKDIPLERQLELTDRSARRFDPLRQALMECQKIYLVTCAGDPDRARSMLRLSAQQYSGWPRIKWLLEKMENRLKRGEAPLRQETDPIPPRSPGNPQLAEPSECNVSTV